MELVIDEGNTRVKAALFINDGIHSVLESEELDQRFLNLIDQQPAKIIYSSTRKQSDAKIDLLGKLGDLIWFDHNTPLPIINTYQTPETLGKDRLAAVIGARFLQPKGGILTIDAGTCITYDLLTSDNRYIGGKISPGSSIRFKALNSFTGNLPLLEPEDHWPTIGTTTNTSIAAGVMHGMCGEINQTIEEYSSHYQELHVFLTGGEARYFVNHIKRKIFANRNLVLLGLHKILKFNDKA